MEQTKETRHGNVRQGTTRTHAAVRRHQPTHNGACDILSTGRKVETLTIPWQEESCFGICSGGTKGSVGDNKRDIWVPQENCVVRVGESWSNYFDAPGLGINEDSVQQRLPERKGKEGPQRRGVGDFF